MSLQRLAQFGPWLTFSPPPGHCPFPMLSLRGLVEMAPPRVGPGLPQAGVTSGASTLSPPWVPGYGYRKAKDARCCCHLQPQGAQERRGGRRGCCAGHEGGALARCTEPPPGRPVTARTSSAAPFTQVRLCRCDAAPFRHRWRGEVGVGNESPRRRHLEREGP